MLAANALGFWTLGSRGPVAFLAHGVSELAKFPLTVYPRFLAAVLTWCLPFAFLSFYPARALLGAVRGSAYAASKAGLMGLTHALALEWAPVIRVNAVMPGLTDTPMTRHSGVTEDEFHARAARIPLQRIGSPHDIARAVRFLLSDDAAYITGQTLRVNGGAVMG